MPRRSATAAQTQPSNLVVPGHGWAYLGIPGHTKPNFAVRAHAPDDSSLAVTRSSSGALCSWCARGATSAPNVAEKKTVCLSARVRAANPITYVSWQVRVSSLGGQKKGQVREHVRWAGATSRCGTNGGRRQWRSVLMARADSRPPALPAHLLREAHRQKFVCLVDCEVRHVTQRHAYLGRSFRGFAALSSRSRPSRSRTPEDAA